MDGIAVESDTLPTDERLRLMDDASRAIESAVELEAVLDVTLAALVPRIADLAVLVLEGAPGGSHLEVAHARPHLVSMLRRKVAESLDTIRDAARASAREGCYARWVPSLNDHALRFLTRGDGVLADLLRSFEVRSLIVLALRAGGRTIGALALARSDSTESFHAADYAAVQVLGRRLALALESAMLRQSLDAELDPQSRVREAVHKWIRVFDLAVWGAAVVDGVDRRLDAVNPAFARMHGYPEPSSLTGRHFADLLPPDRAAELDDWGSEAEQGAYESVHVRHDGSTMPVLVSVTPLDDARPGGSYVVTVQELTDLKRTEERLQRAQRMEAVGRLAGGVAHEVNNMMTIILGFSDLLSRDLAAPGHQDPDERQREVEEIRKAAVRAARITTQLLAFSRQQVLQPADLRLSQVVEEIVPVLRLMLPANVRVETTFAPSPAVVRADRSQLEQVLINLAFNARDAMASGGTIRLVTESRRLDEAAGRRLIGIPIPAGRYGLISVVDTGHGMDRATVAQVFEPFFTTKSVGSGTGLGLSTVYGIVKQSGGYVWVESIPGKGTSFTLCLPEVGRSAEQSEEPPDELPAKGAGGVVLILEDEDGVRELAGRILEQIGYQVAQARNGAEALALLREVPPDLLLTDVIVPDMGTEELEWQVRALCPDLPILYMSGYPRDDILTRGLLRPDQPFLQKPFTGEDLASEVGRMIRRS